MRILLKLLPFVFASFLWQSCSKAGIGNIMMASGTIQKQGFTTYQYGTHLLVAKDRTYVLKSDVIKLDRFVGKHVVITGKSIEPLPEQGPKLYNVIRIN